MNCNRSGIKRFRVQTRSEHLRVIFVPSVVKKNKAKTFPQIAVECFSKQGFLVQANGGEYSHVYICNYSPKFPCGSGRRCSVAALYAALQRGNTEKARGMQWRGMQNRFVFRIQFLFPNWYSWQLTWTPQIMVRKRNFLSYGESLDVFMLVFRGVRSLVESYHLFALLPTCLWCCTAPRSGSSSCTIDSWVDSLRLSCKLVSAQWSQHVSRYGKWHEICLSLNISPWILLMKGFHYSTAFLGWGCVMQR